MKIIFMGTPDFAREILDGLIKGGHEIISVYTGLDKAKNRGHKLEKTPVKILAENNNIKVYQPASLKDESVISEIRSAGADAIVVAAYGKILPPSVLSAAKYGSINVHGSILPKYRGAAPIQRAIINGEKETGVTIMQMADGIDTGDILYIEKIEIGSKETSGQLFERLAKTGSSALLIALDLIEKGKTIPVKQREEDATYAPMLTKEMSKLDFGKTASEIKNLVFGLQPWPCAKIILGDTEIKILDAEVVENRKLNPGEVSVENKEIFIGCGNNSSVKLIKVQKTGKNPVFAKDFLNGVRNIDGTVAK